METKNIGPSHGSCWMYEEDKQTNQIEVKERDIAQEVADDCRNDLLFRRQRIWLNKKFRERAMEKLK